MLTVGKVIGLIVGLLRSLYGLTPGQVAVASPLSANLNFNGFWPTGQAGNLSMAASVGATDLTPVTLTGLSQSLAAGRTYTFKGTVFVSTGGASAGYVLGFGAAGGLTATAFVASAIEANETGQVGQFPRVTSLSGTFPSGATAVITATLYITGTITVNAAGTFSLTGAQGTDTGTTTFLRGSSLVITDMTAA